jgi:hypothetical protein
LFMQWNDYRFLKTDFARWSWSSELDVKCPCSEVSLPGQMLC